MRRSQADSTNRSLAAFGKLQHIRFGRWAAFGCRKGPSRAGKSEIPDNVC